VSDDKQHESTALQVVLDIKTELEEYSKSRDRTALVNALRDQFLAQRHISAAKTELTRQLAAEVLLAKIPNMGENMLIRVVESLARVGEIDMRALLGALPGGKSPLFAFSQVIGGPPGNVPTLTGSSNNPGENPVKHTGQILEALEHLLNYLKKSNADNVE
jgi:hypothetical protein